jgi:hypothetical protein
MPNRELLRFVFKKRKLERQFLRQLWCPAWERNGAATAARISAGFPAGWFGAAGAGGITRFICAWLMGKQLASPT